MNSRSNLDTIRRAVPVRRMEEGRETGLFGREKDESPDPWEEIMR